jgi:hypothetical protein
MVACHPGNHVSSSTTTAGVAERALITTRSFP